MTTMTTAAAAPMTLAPVTLEGAEVRLEPLSLDHVDALWEVGRDPELWRLTVTRVDSIEAMRDYVAEALAQQAAGRAVPFATRHRASGRVIGSTRFGNASVPDRRVEIGWTWLAKPWQRTAANTEAKYLMLRHAFETWGCVRVELKTSRLNERSRAAIRRIGGVEEGTLRRHMLNHDGTWRDSVYFGILDDEWPAVRTRLEAMLASAR